MNVTLRKPLYYTLIASMLLSLLGLAGFQRIAMADPPFTPMGDKLGVNIGLFEFVDAAKTARAFTSSSGTLTLDSNGWPQGDGFTVIHDYRPVAAWLGTGNIDDPDQRQLDGSGTYKLSFTGQADLAAKEDLTSFTVQNKAYNATTNTTTADLVVPAGKALMAIDFSNTRRLPADTTNTGITNMKLIRPGYASHPNQLFTDEFLAAVEPFSTLRAMDYLGMNGFNRPADNLTYGQGAVTEWSDRKLPDYATQSDDSRRTKVHGGAWEYLIELANETGKDLWINIPVSATDDYVEQLADLLKNGPGGNDGLDPGIHLYLEYSNEVWNWAFPQSIYNQAAAEDEVAQGGSNLNNDGATNQYTWGQRRYVRRTVEIGQIFADEFGAGSLNTTLRPIVAWQFGGPSTFSSMLSWLNSTYGDPSDDIYGIAAAPYVTGGDVSNTGTPVQIIQAMWDNSDLKNVNKQSLASLADSYGIKLLGYEGGMDSGSGGSTVNIGNKILANRDPLMGNLLVHDLRDNWYAQGGDLFMYYSLSGLYSRYGSWGLTDLITDLDTVKYNAALDIVNGTAPASNPNQPPAYHTTTADPANPDLLYGAVTGSSSSGMNYKALDRDTATAFAPAMSYGTAGLDLGAGNAATVVKFRIRSGTAPNNASGFVQGSNDGVNFTQLAQVPTGLTANQWYDYTITDPIAYRYVRFIGNQYFQTSFQEIEFYKAADPNAPLAGTIFGSAAAAMNAKALDGDTSTVFANGAAYGYAGLDLGAGNAKTITKFRYYPDGTATQPWLKDRTSGTVEGSNDGVNYTVLGHVPSAAGYGQWYEISLSDTTAYRYVRWYGNQYFYTQVKEIEFISNPDDNG